jgi:hypothetical protein
LAGKPRRPISAFIDPAGSSSRGACFGIVDVLDVQFAILHFAVSAAGSAALRFGRPIAGDITRLPQRATQID